MMIDCVYVRDQERRSGTVARPDVTSTEASRLAPTRRTAASNRRR